MTLALFTVQTYLLRYPSPVTALTCFTLTQHCVRNISLLCQKVD